MNRRSILKAALLIPFLSAVSFGEDKPPAPAAPAPAAAKPYADGFVDLFDG